MWSTLSSLTKTLHHFRLYNGIFVSFPGEARVGVRSQGSTTDIGIVLFFCEIIDLGSTHKNELAQHPVMILTSCCYALLRPDPCLVSHHTRSGALKHGHQEWLPRHIKSSYKIVLVCGKSLEIFGPGLWTCSSLR